MSQSLQRKELKKAFIKVARGSLIRQLHCSRLIGNRCLPIFRGFIQQLEGHKLSLLFDFTWFTCY